MLLIIFLSAMLIVAAALYGHNQTSVKPNKNMLLGVTLPYGSLNDDAVNGIVSKYKRMHTILILLLLPFAAPILLFSSYASLSVIYMFAWVGILLYINYKTFILHHRQLLSLKRKNNWFVGNKHMISIDTEVSRIKDKMPVSSLWFLPSLIIGIIPLMVTLLKNGDPGASELMLSLLAVPFLLVFMCLYKLNLSQKTTVYSEKTEINKACNFLHRRLWSICWVTLAAFGSICMNALSFVLLNKRPGTIAIIIIPVLLALACLLFMAYTHNKIRVTQNRLLLSADKPVYTDDDEYWQKGYYYNPNDNRTMVEKRVGYGYTLNMATTKGKLTAYGIAGGITVLILGLSFLFLKLDFTGFNLSIDGNMATIHAPIYGYHFYIDGIEEIKKVETIPKGIKTNGAETSKYSLGNYDLEGYGNSKLYIYKENVPFISIKLRDTYVFINGKTDEETEQYYHLLQENMQ